MNEVRMQKVTAKNVLTTGELGRSPSGIGPFGGKKTRKTVSV